tara:strand:- start:18 stop:1451 length:1434 start_codon:yes stop_codon:yes gene_type:complete
MSVMENALSYYVKKFSGYTTNTFKIQPSGKTSGIQANDIITINLPSNAIVDLRHFKVFFNAGIANAGAGINGRLPAKIDSLFSRVEILVGGVQVQQGNPFYNVLRHLKDAVCGDKTNPVNGHPEICRSVTGSGTAGISNDNSENFLGTDAAAGSVYTSTTDSPYCVDYWDGFIGTAEPRLLDLSLVGSVQVRITCAPDSVLTNSDNVAIPTTQLLQDNSAVSTFTGPGTGLVSYEIKNIFATIECVNLADETYDAMLGDMMSERSYLPVPFKNYFAFQQSHTGSSKFQISTQSLDRVWSAYRPTTNVTGSATVPTMRSHTAQGPPLLVPGYVVNPATTRRGTTIEKYVSPSFAFSTLGPSTTYQLQINNAFIPQAALSGPELASYTACNLPPHEFFPDDLTMAEYELLSNVGCTRLNMINSEDNRVISGLDTRNSNVMCSLNSTGSNFAGATFDSIVFLEVTSEMRISSGRQVIVVN